MTSGATSRLMREGRDVSTQVVPVLFAQPDESDILHWRAMILGPPGGPYSLGYFHFDMKFPQDYPNSAPKVLITTTSGGMVRFNPNLYSTGKVCLSILGTWRAEHSGEQWSAVQSVQSILMSIQSLMNDTPYHNEPSFEEDDGSGDVQKYNEKIAHETLRVGVCEVMEETLMLRAQSSNGVCPLFAATRRVLFLMYYERYLADSRALCDKKECRDGQPFKMMPFECSSNGMHGQFQWGQVRGRLEKIHAALLASIDEWKRKGAEQTAQLKAKQDSQVTACIHHLHQQVERIKHEMPASASIGPADDNTCVWTATIFGPSETVWDGGMFEAEFVFPPDFPDAPPYIRFLTPIFHPQISPSGAPRRRRRRRRAPSRPPHTARPPRPPPSAPGVPYLRTLLLWSTIEPKEKTPAALLNQLVQLLSKEPSPEPVTHLNQQAAALHFSRSDDDRKEYKRQVKKRVQRSLEG